jgi:hypothetical protein
MSERQTSIGPRPQGHRTASGNVIPGISVYGRETRPAMIERFRRHYQRQLEEAQAALALTDDQLIVKTYVGSWARKGEKEVTE